MDRTIPKRMKFDSIGKSLRFCLENFQELAQTLKGSRFYVPKDTPALFSGNAIQERIARVRETATDEDARSAADQRLRTYSRVQNRLVRVLQ